MHPAAIASCQLWMWEPSHPSLQFLAELLRRRPEHINLKRVVEIFFHILLKLPRLPIAILNRNAHVPQCRRKRANQTAQNYPEIDICQAVAYKKQRSISDRAANAD